MMIGNRQERKEFESFEQYGSVHCDVIYHTVMPGVSIDQKGCIEYDKILRWKNHKIFVEEKIRDGIYNDILVELVQDASTCTLGWFYTMRPADTRFVYTMFNGQGGDLVTAVNWKHEDLVSFLSDKSMWRFTRPHISYRGMGLTVNLAIPCDILFRESIIKEFGVDLNEVNQEAKRRLKQSA